MGREHLALSVGMAIFLLILSKISGKLCEDCPWSDFCCLGEVLYTFNRATRFNSRYQFPVAFGIVLWNYVLDALVSVLLNHLELV